MDSENNKQLEDLLNHETTECITKYASALCSKNEVFNMMGFDEDDKDNIMLHPVFEKAYKIGVMQTEYNIRAAVVQLAVNGSAPAQIEAVKLLEKLKIENA
jgi:hypothetical protein